MDRGKAYGAVFNPILLAKSKEVVQIIEDIAYTHRFGCNDLILAVLWQCLGQTTKTPEPQVKKPNTIYVYPKDTLNISPSKGVDNKYRSSTSQHPTTYAGKSASKATDKSSTFQSRSDSSNGTNKNRNKNQTYLKNQTVPDNNVEVINIDDDDDDVVDEIVSSEVQEVEEISHDVEVTHEIEEVTTELEEVTTELEEVTTELEEVTDDVEEVTHELEEVSNDVEDSSHDVVEVSHDKEESSPTKTVLVENVECSYFDMDCDEIDENEDQNDDDVVPLVEVIETKPSEPSDEVTIIEDKVEDFKDTSERSDIQTTCTTTLDSVGLQPSTLDSIGLQPKSSAVSTQSVNITTVSISGTTSIVTSSQVTVSTSLQVSTSTVSKLSDASLPTCISPSELAESTWTEADGPPRKKRLLDHDKKWHMAPKHNADQDKYLALPGGIDPSDDEEEAAKDSNTNSSARQSQSPPTVGIEIDHVDFGDFGQSPTNLETKTNENSEDDIGDKPDRNNKSEDCEIESNKEKSSKSVGTSNEYSNLKKPSGLKNSSQGSMSSSSLQISKIGRKGFGRKTDETGDSKVLVNTQSRKSTRMSSRQSKFRVGKARKYFSSDTSKKSTLHVQASAGTSGNKSKDKSKLKNIKQRKGLDTKRYKTKCGRPRKLDQSDSGKKNAKLDSGSDIDSPEEIGYVEASEWTTEFNKKEAKKRSRAGSGSRSSRRSPKGTGKSSKPKKSSDPHVEVLVMDMDDIKFFDDIPDVMGSNETGETSREQETQAGDGDNSDSDVIVLD